MPVLHGIMAAPNQIRITARVITTAISLQYADRTEMELEVLQSKSIMGPNFARPGEIVSGFTFEPAEEILAGSVIKADAEYIGDAYGGRFRLKNITLVY